MSLQEILIVSTEPTLDPKLQRLSDALSKDGLVSVSHWPTEDPDFTLDACIANHLPDLVLIDLADWDTEDLERVQTLCNQIQQAALGDYRPVTVLLTYGESANQRIEYFVVGADDILDGRLEEDEMRVRLLAHLRRNLDLLSNRLTQLPSLPVLKRIIQRKLAVRHPWTLLLCHLDNLGAYKASYGNVPAQQAVKQVARLVGSILIPPDWLCQGNDETFLLLTQPEKAEKLANIICRRFDQEASQFYSEQDKERGYLVAVDGTINRRVNLMKLSVGIVNNREQPLEVILNKAQQLAFLASHESSSQWVSDRYRLEREASESPCGEKKPRVLIIESDAALAYLLQTTLEMQGYEAEAVSSVEEAEDSALTFRPWLVILDALLNEQPVGFDLCERLKAKRPDCRVVFLSALHERDKALSAGADIYMAKPFELIPLLTSITQLMDEMSFLGGCLPDETGSAVN